MFCNTLFLIALQTYKTPLDFLPKSLLLQSKDHHFQHHKHLLLPFFWCHSWNRIQRLILLEEPKEVPRNWCLRILRSSRIQSNKRQLPPLARIKYSCKLMLTMHKSQNPKKPQITTTNHSKLVSMSLPHTNNWQNERSTRWIGYKLPNSLAVFGQQVLKDILIKGLNKLLLLQWLFPTISQSMTLKKSMIKRKMSKWELLKVLRKIECIAFLWSLNSLLYPICWSVQMKC